MNPLVRKVMANQGCVNEKLLLRPQLREFSVKAGHSFHCSKESETLEVIRKVSSYTTIHLKLSTDTESSSHGRDISLRDYFAIQNIS